MAIKSLNAQHHLRRKVKTPDGDGMLLSYNNLEKFARILVDGEKESKQYSYNELELYGDDSAPAGAATTPNEEK